MSVQPFYRNFKIKNKIFSISLLLLLIFCLIGMVTYQYFTTLYEKRIYQESADMLQLSSSVLDEELNKVENLSFQVSTDVLIQTYLQTINESEVSYELYQTKTRLLGRLLDFASTKKYISSMQVIDANGEKYTTGYNTSVENDPGKIGSLLLNTKGSNVWTNIEGANAISSARLIRRKENLGLDNLGKLIISIDMDEFVNKTLNFSPNKNFVITSKDEIFYQRDEDKWKISDFQINNNGNGYMVKEINGSDYLLTYTHSRFSDLNYYHLLPYEDITKQTRTIKRIMIICFLFMLTLTIWLSRRAAQNISKPLEDLSAGMKQVENGNFEVPTTSYHDDEVGQLHHNFRVMLNKINELIKENYTKQLMIKETEYKALQAQINPHFLYNTLDSINWLAKINQQKKISVMAENLGSMMRNIISKKEATITVQEEMEIVRNYITIQKYRYEDRLDFTLTTDPEFDRVQIPKLTIQPVVENAIQHGLEEMVTACKVDVELRQQEEDLLIMVSDNGPGIEEDKLEGIYRGEIKSKSSGIGLKNINERIKMMFGERYGLTIDSKFGQGTTVNLLIPLVTE
ncbi:sensor histidine kinase [Halobacillus salinarum]|uniref:histidine kinase n=1 Tax=Halobacillus salinarum TaxID=2932257 RepID=A0ABY4EHS6_9BACI|nr:sensor histidine kinase [Halobacillus salinarum]UOQ43980.1 sensor histidine kinase [Halobacillus salinarum]